MSPHATTVLHFALTCSDQTGNQRSLGKEKYSLPPHSYTGIGQRGNNWLIEMHVLITTTVTGLNEKRKKEIKCKKIQPQTSKEPNSSKTTSHYIAEHGRMPRREHTVLKF